LWIKGKGGRIGERGKRERLYPINGEWKLADPVYEVANFYPEPPHRTAAKEEEGGGGGRRGGEKEGGGKSVFAGL